MGFLDKLKDYEDDNEDEYSADSEKECPSMYNAGLSIKKNIEPKEVDLEELHKGIKVEYEHTNDISLAMKIATDHLAEIPDYYTRLAEMEAESLE